jgi:multidrug transporter EmrE-like cation transporter
MPITWVVKKFMRAYFYVFLTIALTVYGQMAIKARAMVHARAAEGAGFLLSMFLDPWVLSGLAAALAASGVWMLAVRTADLSAIYPIMALTFVIIPALAVVTFGEKLAPMQMVGIALIVVGVALSAGRA